MVFDLFWTSLDFFSFCFIFLIYMYASFLFSPLFSFSPFFLINFLELFCFFFSKFSHFYIYVWRELPCFLCLFMYFLFFLFSFLYLFGGRCLVFCVCLCIFSSFFSHFYMYVWRVLPCFLCLFMYFLFFLASL